MGKWAGTDIDRFVEERLAAIVDSSFDAIVGKNLDSIITSWNAAAERMFQYTAEEAIGQDVRFLKPPEPPDHPLLSRATITAQDLHNLDFIALSPEDTTRRALDDIMQRLSVTPRVVAETPFAQTICAMVMAGLGCGIVNPVAAAPFAGRGIELKPFLPVVPFRTLLIRSAEGPASRVVGDFIRALDEEIALAQIRLSPS